MATTSQGYKCEFTDSVPEDFYCKKCTLVARRLIFTSCCEETFCYTCLVDSKNQDKPCPVCGEEEFSMVELKKYQNRVKQLQVYCNMKERGCVWSGTLDQLDTHLDPDLDNCLYIDIECPLNCQQTIPKNKMEDHVDQCSNRPYACIHCGYKGSFEDVLDKHLPQCKHADSPHPSAGCNDSIVREDQEEQAKQESAAFPVTESKKKSNKKLLELLQKHHKEKKILKTKIEEQEKQLKDQEEKLREQDRQLSKQAQQLGEYEGILTEQKMKLEEQEMNITKLEEVKTNTIDIRDSKLNPLEESLQAYQKTISDWTSKLCLDMRFVMDNYRREKVKDKINDWQSPAMYTHLLGYKFCVGVDANGQGGGRGKAIYVDLRPMSGEFDEELKWPANVMFTIKLVKQISDQLHGYNIQHTQTITWRRNENANFSFTRIPNGFIEHNKLSQFIIDGKLHFHVNALLI